MMFSHHLLRSFFIFFQVRRIRPADKRVITLILENNQHDAQLFFLTRLFQFSACFEQRIAHHQENQLYQYNFCYMSHCVGERLVCRSGRSSFPTCILDGHVHSVTCNRICIDTIDSPDDEHCAARNI